MSFPVCDKVAEQKKRYMKAEARFCFHISLLLLNPIEEAIGREGAKYSLRPLPKKVLRHFLRESDGGEGQAPKKYSHKKEPLFRVALYDQIS